ncbi:MAG: methylated-DNA--[protein]-cysteine S-methyltransferase [Deltaproteobacteria bacterium]|nr:methylated-DNA--[protein]-cysteine S-methyltransferase [Deltaproteobacteria bacterium]
MSWVVFETSLGPCAVAWSEAGLTRVLLPERDADTTRAKLLERVPGAGAMASSRATPAWVKDAITRVCAHLDGRPQDLSRIPLDLTSVTPFDAKVLRAAQSIPSGRTLTYGEVAGIAGSPRAARAVGRAMATNPFPVVVPCHRVVASGGKPGGFSAPGGLVTKERLLAIEGGTLERQGSLFASAPGRVGPSAGSLPFDGKAAVRHLVDADPVLAKHIAKVGPLRLEIAESESTFATLAESIVYQQLHAKAAATIFGRVRALFRHGRLDPTVALRLSDADLRSAGLSAGKLASLRDLARRASDGAIPTLVELEKMDDEAIVEALTPVRGVGRWTVEMLLVFRLGRPDVLPLADFGIKKGFSRVFPRRAWARTKDDELPTPEVVARRGERWRPFRSVASWYLWRATDAKSNEA